MSEFRTAVVGPGPHEIRHDLGQTWSVTHVLDDQQNALPAAIQSTDANTTMISVGYFGWVSFTEMAWIPGCANDAVVHVWIHA